MEFEERISSSDKSYYINTITGETQWGSKNFFNKNIPLPKGYICLISNGEDVYKYIGNDNRKKLELMSYSYAPKYFDTESQKIIKETYKNLEDVRTEQAKDEIYRRIELFKNVAKLLKRTPESIIDESLEFLSGKADVLPQIIIGYIRTAEHEELGENGSLTAFSTISQMDPSFSSERSIRELCGLNMREEELSNAVKQLKHFTCGISLELIQDPVMTGCANGHTSDKDSMKDLLQRSLIRRCPTCNDPLPKTISVTALMPNVFAKQIIEEFVDKYVNQRGEIWTEIKETCIKYKVETKLKEIAKKEAREEYLREQQEIDEYYDTTGRTAEEIRNFLLNEEYYTPAQIEGIPEAVAGSTESSYMQALAETIRIGRPRHPHYQLN